MSTRPKKGERYQVKNAFTASVLTSWKAPFTGGAERTIPSGLRFVVAHDPPLAATAIAADVEPASEWEATLVAAEDLRDPKYGGYYLVIPFERVAIDCTLIP